MKMKHLLVLICSLLVVMTVISCSERHNDYPLTMRQAEACMDIDPDSAFACLSRLRDSIAYEPKETQMYYWLLTIQADEKRYILHTSDSLINAIVSFYRKHGDSDKLMMAYHYQGCVYRDMNDAPRAVECFLDAVDVGEKIEQNTFLGLIYGQLGTLFAYQDLFDESLEAKRKSLHYYTLQKDVRRIPGALCGIARMYGIKQEPDSAVFYYREAVRAAQEAGRAKSADDILSELGCLLADMGQLDSAKQILLPLYKKGGFHNVEFNLGKIYLWEEKMDSAELCLKQAAVYGTIYQRYSAYLNMTRLEAKRHNYRKALDYAFQTQELSDTIDTQTQTEAIKKIQSLYDYHHTTQKNIRLEQENATFRYQLLTSILTLILVIFAALYWMHRIRMNKMRVIEQERRVRLFKEYQYRKSLAYIQENEQKLKELKVLLEKAEKENDELNRQLLLSQKEMLELENRQQRMEQANREIEGIALKHSDAYLRFHRAASEEHSRLVEDDWNELHAAVDNAYSHFTDRLYNLYPNLSSQELRICLLIKIEIPNKGMAVLLSVSPSAITQARKRLYRKISGEAGSGESLDKMILDL